MHFSTLTVLGFAALASSHIIMTSPVPFDKSTLNSSPLAADGSDFPCKLRGTTFTMEDPVNVMPIGSTQTLAFEGSAVHGGGSCQVSIAMLPSGKTLSTLTDSDAKSLSFKVIHSIEGGCPMQNIAGNNGDSATIADPDTYNFTIPSSVPTGPSIISWSWLNKVGNREFYQNCGPINITGSTSKRDTSAFDALPDMFVANIGNGCTSQDSKDVIFPNPGDSLLRLGLQTSSALASPTGASCQKASGAVATGSSSAAVTVATSVAVTSAASTAVATSTGGVFVSTPVASSTATSTAMASASITASASAPTSTASTTGSNSTTPAGTACSSEGMYNCISGTSFQQCASGLWSAVQPLASGTQCQVGLSDSMNITAIAKRRMRFPREHLRRYWQQ